MHTPYLTVIIPTYNRAASLERVLKSLEAAEKPASLAVEVLVVNNCSSDRTKDYLAREANKPHSFAFTALDETRQGKANAVNRALRFSRGQVMLILDDDHAGERPRCC